MPNIDPKQTLHRYLIVSRDALLWKLDGLSEYDVRRPLVPSGTNLLGLIKHVGAVGVGYFGECFDRPFPEPVPWFDEGGHPNADLYVTASETRDDEEDYALPVWAGEMNARLIITSTIRPGDVLGQA